MAKVITFSRTFPAYHPNKGQPTYFVEKFLRSFCNDEDLMGTTDNEFFSRYCENAEDLSLIGLMDVFPKYHTIRSGNRWKQGDYFSPRVWSGKPYNSKQIIIGPDIEIVKIFDFSMDLNSVYSVNGKYISEQTEYNIALNDGLTESEMQFWFMPDMNKPKEFHGQIICWNPNINY